MKVLPRNTILLGDARRILPELLSESVDTIVTSPPYPAGVRDYGVAGQFGHEHNIDAYVAELRVVARELYRLLKPSGSLWLNVGDFYSRQSSHGVPRQSLLLAPQRLALALSTDGWLVRNVCVWHKPNPLPQSATNRLSATYEVVLFATKTRRYFFDLDAIRVPHRSATRVHDRELGRTYQGGNGGLGRLKAQGRVGHPNGKNPGDLWTIATARDGSEHQATFPEALVERPILATCPERICVQCDRAWRRPVRVFTVRTAEGARTVRRVGRLARCDCFAPTRAGLVLDPFMGTGTTAVVARRLGRDWLGIELNPRYVTAAWERLGERGRRAA